jgi:3(or 17)beta-hydroxysteroid dehydrogenase
MQQENTNRLEGKVALISGAAKGIGLAIAELFRDEGALVYVTDIFPSLPMGTKTEDDMHYFELDVCSEVAWQSVTDTIVKDAGSLDIVVNNAGILGLGHGPQNPEEASLESWNLVHSINLAGVFLGCKYGIKAMRKNPARSGSIVNMASRSGVVGVPGMAAYASSKAGVRNHTRSVALYCGQKGYNIRCNSLNPADILTDMWETMLGQGDARERALRQTVAGIPLGHMGEPRDVAAAALFLASDEAKFITGSELNIDGGVLAGSASAPSAHE